MEGHISSEKMSWRVRRKGGEGKGGKAAAVLILIFCQGD